MFWICLSHEIRRNFNQTHSKEPQVPANVPSADQHGDSAVVETQVT